jgi:molybdate transport system regulatory protein
MRVSARNVFEGTVKSVLKGLVNAQITLVLQGGETIIAVITNTSADLLELKEGKSAYAIIKASEVMIGKDLVEGTLSARNILAGKITNLHPGAVNSEIEVTLQGGAIVIATITNESVKTLGLVVEDKVSAIVKASNVLIGV